MTNLVARAFRHSRDREAGANLGDAADTTAAITGQLAGAIYGASAIPVRWLSRLAWEPKIRTLASDLFEAGNA